jgi:hypothetical protein
VWVDDADAQNSPQGPPYVVAKPASAAGFIFSYPLRSGRSKDIANKILWVVRTPRNGGALHIEAHPRGASVPTVTEIRPGDSGPGEIYPDGLNVPTAGCWHFTLRWPTGTAELDLEYVATR